MEKLEDRRQGRKKQITNIMVVKMIYGIEKEKVDEQGRFVLPSDWRAEELKGSREVFVIKGKGYLKMRV